MTTAAGSDGANAGAAGAAAGAAGAAGGQQGGQQGGQAGAAAAAVDYKFEALEGVTPEFDADITATAKELGWSLEQASKFRAREFKLAQSEIAADKEAQAQAAAKAKIDAEQRALQTKQAHEKANREDPEFGGQKYHETTQRVEQLFAMAGERGKALMAEMGEHAPGLLNTPSFRNFLAFFAYKMADGKFHEGANGQTTEAPKTFADVAYGNKYPAAAR